MEQPTQKKAWVTPELTVLVRSKPEEAVLGDCKTAGTSGPSADFSGCWKKDCGFACETFDFS